MNVKFKAKIEKKPAFPQCGRCQAPVDTDELHSCPYQCEINDDCSDHCTCCDECQHECAMDI